MTNHRVIKVDFLSAKVPVVTPKNVAVRRVVTNIKKYFSDPKLRFNLPINLEGTELQKKIWHALPKIPHGQTVTYGELAKKLKTGPRVIGNACRMNPLPIILPCHRVVSAQGLGGYGGSSNRGIKIKQWLLAHENKNPTF